MMTFVADVSCCPMLSKCIITMLCFGCLLFLCYISSNAYYALLQLPTRSGQYKPQEEPSDSEEDGSEEDDLEEELSEGSEYIHFKVDESEDDGSEEDELEEELSEGQASEEDLPEGEEPGEDQSEEERSEKSVEEPLGNGCENLIFLKMMNFMGRHNEMRLLSFLLKRSASLNQLILFTPSDHPKGLHKDHLVTSDFLETKLLPLEKASLNAQIILSEPDTTAVQPLHWEIFVKV
jgi:hypothetical protein